MNSRTCRLCAEPLDGGVPEYLDLCPVCFLAAREDAPEVPRVVTLEARD